MRQSYDTIIRVLLSKRSAVKCFSCNIFLGKICFNCVKFLLSMLKVSFKSGNTCRVNLFFTIFAQIYQNGALFCVTG